MSDFTGEVLALDLAKTTGWCVGAPGPSPRKFGTIKFGTAGASRAAVYRLFRETLDLMITTRIRRVVFESASTPIIMGGNRGTKTNPETIKMLVGLTEHLEEYCHGRVELREATTSQVRSHFLGTNNNKREQAKLLTKLKCRDLGWDVDNDDEADACALWSYQVCIITPKIAHTHSPLFKRSVAP